jgi:serine/threonine protein kinase
MNYPTFDQYQATLQSPKTCFKLKELQNGTIEKDLWGLPRVRSGGFALTYRIWGKYRCMAVRCFHKDVQDRSQRYTYISKFIREINNSCFTPISYIHKGIRINNTMYPITNMDWVEGDTLEKYINSNINDPSRINTISQRFTQLIKSLSDINMAHGDLSHQNILVNGNELVLVDCIFKNLTGSRAMKLDI